MIKAFVFGKFLPFHKGHEAMINFALSKCDFLSVLICCSDKEIIPDTIRKKWIEDSFNSERKIEVKCLNYSENDLPNTSESSIEVSEIWSRTFNSLFPNYDLLITSEVYGSYVAEFMGIQHIAFDIPRNLFPFSATQIRRDLFSHWKNLPDSVKPDFAVKVVILGTESTGKTTLTQRLSRYFNCTSVPEAGRELIPDSRSFQFEDLHLVAREHARLIRNASISESPLIIIDTDIHITKSYAQFIFGKSLDVREDIYKANNADLYLYLNKDVEYYQDGTRLSEKERNLLDESHRNILSQHNIHFEEIRGNWDERFEKAVESIKLITKKTP